MQNSIHDWIVVYRDALKIISTVRIVILFHADSIGQTQNVRRSFLLHRLIPPRLCRSAVPQHLKCGVLKQYSLALQNRVSATANWL